MKRVVMVLVAVAVQFCSSQYTETSGSDSTAPTFSGVESFTQPITGSYKLSWQTATDDISVSSKIQYLIYASSTTGGFNYSSPKYYSGQGDLFYTITGDTSAGTMYYVVRARDETGNIDSNTKYVSSNGGGTVP